MGPVTLARDQYMSQCDVSLRPGLMPGWGRCWAPAPSISKSRMGDGVGVEHHLVTVYCDRTLKKQEFISQDLIRGFSMKLECVNTHINIQYHDIQVINQLLHIKYHIL
jgi:hypothetical protein